MRLCIRHRGRAAAVAHYRRLEETLWRELEPLPNQEICLPNALERGCYFELKHQTIEEQIKHSALE